jgi:rhodanese-related sulfurtransferase
MRQQMPFKEATPRDVKQRLDAGEEVTLIDVREPDEMMIAAIDGAEERPMSQARDWIDSLPKDRELVIFCHHGGRSAQVAMALAHRGHTNVTNMSGGIDAWSEDVDPSVPRY